MCCGCFPHPNTVRSATIQCHRWKQLILVIISCMNEILFIFMRIAHKLHSHSYRRYFTIIRELLLYFVHFIIICEFNFILFNVQLYQVWFPCLTHVSTLHPPPPHTPQRHLSSFNPLLPRPLTSSKPGISGRSQIAADTAGHMDGQPCTISLISSSLDQNIQ